MVQKIVVLLIDQFCRQCLRYKIILRNHGSENSSIIN